MEDKLATSRLAKQSVPSVLTNMLDDEVSFYKGTHPTGNC